MKKENNLDFAGVTRLSKIIGFLTRENIAHMLMVAFVIFTCIGAALIYLPAGCITLGVTAGLYAYLLGSE